MESGVIQNDGYLGVVCFACQAAHGQDDLLSVLAALNGIDLHLLGGQAQVECWVFFGLCVFCVSCCGFAAQ